jgi:hypothetical protein
MRFLPLLAGFVQVSAALAQTAPTPSFFDRQDYGVCFPGGPSIAVADFNGDGIPDLICSEPYLFLGNGNGTFGSGTVLHLSSYAGNPLPVDLNGDGNMDIAAIGNVLNSGPYGILVSLATATEPFSTVPGRFSSGGYVR